MTDSKCTTIKTQDDLPDGDDTKQFTNAKSAELTNTTLLATVLTQSGVFASGDLETGQWGADISSGGVMYWKAEEGLFTLTASIALSS